MKTYLAAEHVRQHMTEAADEGALFIRRLLRGEVPNTKENLELATQARASIASFTRYEATLSARDQTSVVVSKMLAGENADEFRRYIEASMPEHPAVRVVTLALASGDEERARG